MPNQERLIYWFDDQVDSIRIPARELEKQLAARGLPCKVQCVRPGDNGIVCLRRERVDVVIMDLHFAPLPDGSRANGIDYIKEIRRGDTLVPVIVYSCQPWNFAKPLAGIRGDVQGVLTVDPRSLENLVAEVASILDGELPRILHLSDLHFGTFHAYNDYQRSLAGYLEEDVSWIKTSLKPNLIAITGDLTSKADSGEFTKAREFIVWLSQSLDVPLSHVAIVPGNHDVKLSDTNCFREYVLFLEELFGSPGEQLGSMTFFGPDGEEYSWSDAQPNACRDCRDLFFARRVSNVQCEILGVNSSVVTTEKAYRVPGYHNGVLGSISANQVKALRRLQPEAQPSTGRRFRIAMLHHQVMGVPSIHRSACQEQTRVVGNLSLFLDVLSGLRADIVLHGHSHYPAMNTITVHFSGTSKVVPYPSHVVAAGTMGGITGRDEVHDHNYAFVEVKRDAGADDVTNYHLRVQTRIHNANTGRWSTMPNGLADVALAL